jgi:hypothetical protein
MPYICSCPCLAGEDLAIEELSGGSAQNSAQQHRQMAPAAQRRLLCAARTELDTATRLRLPPASVAMEDDGQLHWTLERLVQACGAYAACAAVVAAGADATVAVEAWSHAGLFSGACASTHCFKLDLAFVLLCWLELKPVL